MRELYQTFDIRQLIGIAGCLELSVCIEYGCKNVIPLWALWLNY